MNDWIDHSSDPGRPALGSETPRVVVALNALLDQLPRMYFNRLVGRVPAFRSCGIAGFYLAIVVTIGVGLARGRSLAVLLVLCATCGVSFYAYALARKAITDRERLVLLEQVWFALACCAGVLIALGERPLAYLDAVACGLAFFLAAGRIGCFLVGCCHGLPSLLGVCYGEQQVRDGLPSELPAVRLFPVQLIEAFSLVVIGIATSGLGLFGREHGALVFFLVAYGVVRFGLEGLRGDRRPHFLGLSQARWMAIAEAGTAVWLSKRWAPVARAETVVAAVAVTCLVGCVGHRFFGFRARALRPIHLEELRSAARRGGNDVPVTTRSSLGFIVASSEGGHIVSLALPNGRDDLRLVAEVAGAAFPELDPTTSRIIGSLALFELPLGIADTRGHFNQVLDDRLFERLASGRQEALEKLSVSTEDQDDTRVSTQTRPQSVERSGYFEVRDV